MIKEQEKGKNLPVETPLMKQYMGIKARYPDALLLFRVGDFYETFGEDAIRTAKILGIVLTKRANGAAAYVELAGFPHHSLDSYLPKLVRAGNRVAICDQLEDPKLTKTIVKRGVTEVVTPGVAINDKILESKQNNYLAAIHFAKSGEYGIALLDISTGEFLCSQGNKSHIEKLIQSFGPSEIVYQKNLKNAFESTFGTMYYVNTLDEWIFQTDYANETLLKHFGTKSLKGFGIEDLEHGIIAASVVLNYLNETEHRQLHHIATISRIEEEQFVWLDRFTLRNLELLHPLNANGVPLVSVIDKTETPMGARMLRRWITMPLKKIEAINQRLNIVSYLKNDTNKQNQLTNYLEAIGDLERLISKVAVGKANPRELLQLKKAVDHVNHIKILFQSSENLDLKNLVNSILPCEVVAQKIEKYIKQEPAVLITKGNVIADGVNKDLDELRAISFSGKDYLLQIQAREIEVTGITSLKVAYNNVFGYYIEVTNTHKDKVPTSWTRKQTLTNAERYITEELKQYEEKILGADEKILVIEQRIYNELLIQLSDYIHAVQFNASVVAKLDCLNSFSLAATLSNYVRPNVNDGSEINIKLGRHPVIELQLPLGEQYVANDVFLDTTQQQIIMITGPNMSGKSALLRQTALICLMAQMGSYVPAAAADLGYVDKIFTRVGASDNITSGESTFMVEMNETASILNNLSNRSLILLDEIGRGTSTYDGISIAWAIAEYIHNNTRNKAKTLFATHYHELNDMTNRFERIKNYNVSVKEIDNKILFTRKLVKGGSEHSFGIHVAQMAGMPKTVVDRASEILKELETLHEQSEILETSNGPKVKHANTDSMQLSFFNLDDPILEDIRKQIISIDINTLTPVEALMKLSEIKKILGK